MDGGTDATAVFDSLPALDGEIKTAVIRALDRSADASRATSALEQLASSAPDQTAAALADDQARTVLVTLAATSRSLIRWLGAHPDDIDTLGDPQILTPLDYPDALLADGLAAVDAGESPENALRLWKQRKFLRVAIRDLLALSTFAEVGESLSNIADAAMHAALVIASDGRPDELAIIAMGKLGGRELNYSSDVDVMLVNPDGADPDAASKIARRFLDVMSTPTSEGIVWRVDTNLRPEGRAGAMTRSLDGYISYYERWAKAWEFQALIKRRAASGNHELGLAFVGGTEPFVYPQTFPPERIDEIRTLKARAEAQVAQAGLTDREVKLGRGGIRDVEFAVQLLQLVHGPHDPTIRSPTTLTALYDLGEAGYISHDDGNLLASSYIKLRTVEHTLQLEDEAQIHALPKHSEKLDHLARVLGFQPDRTGSAADHFLEDFRTDLANVRSVHERLFYRPLLEAFAKPAPDQRVSPTALEERLEVFGFSDVRATRRALSGLTSGLSRRSKLMEAIMPLVLGWLSDTPDPNLGLLMLERLTAEPHRAEAITAVFRESPLAAQRLCRLIGTSRLVGEGLERFPELVQMLEDDDALAKPRARDELAEIALRQLAWRGDPAERLRTIRRFVQRERVRTAIRDLLGFASSAEVSDALTAVAEVSLEGALRTAAEQVEHAPAIAVIGMGSFGGRELSYNSDLDIMIVYDEHASREGGEPFRKVEKIIAHVIESLGALTAEGRAYELDLDLRPEGRSGVLARSLPAYEKYWDRWADTWEFQALTRARHVAGDAVLGAEFLDAAARRTYPAPFPESRALDIRKMKARIDKERIPRGADPKFHMKLGPGGFTDIEFAVQLQQMRHGGEDPSVRNPSTLHALEALVEGGYVRTKAAARLDSAFRLVRSLRTRLVLLGAREPNELPQNYADLSKLARSLGYEENPAPTLREEYRKRTRRAHIVADELLFDTDT